MFGFVRYLFLLVVFSFILFFFFKTMKETKIYQSKRWRKHVKTLFVMVVSSIAFSTLVLGTYIYLFEGVH